MNFVDPVDFVLAFVSPCSTVQSCSAAVCVSSKWGGQWELFIVAVQRYSRLDGDVVRSIACWNEHCATEVTAVDVQHTVARHPLCNCIHAVHPTPPPASSFRLSRHHWCAGPLHAQDQHCQPVW